MSLRSALEQLPSDRETEARVKDILALFRRHIGEWMDSGRVAKVIEAPESSVEKMLDMLHGSFVLDFDDDPPRYSYHRDTLLDLEIDRFLRRANSRSGAFQSNVERFRQRYGGK